MPEKNRLSERTSDADGAQHKLWGGRFSESTDVLVERLNNSLSFDARLWREDIAGSIAHATMLGEQGIIPEVDSVAIVEGLRAVESGVESGELTLDSSQEDIHSAVEALLRERIGPTAGKLHTARSRNDQVATDTRLYLRRVIEEVDALLARFQETLVDLAERELAPFGEPANAERSSESTVVNATILPGYTHLQHAQPILLSHHLLAYFWMFQRDRDRLADCAKRVNQLPLGAGALAGTSFSINRERVAALLKFDGICENSLDAVSDRDFALEFLGAASILIMHCSRLAEEIILWNSPEFAFVELDDSVTTGSSIMPQKKNPDVAELARGKSGRVYGNLIALLTVMKGLPLTYNKDMQEDKEPVFDTVDTLMTLLPPFEKTLRTARFRRERMIQSLRGDFSTATDLADYLVRQAMPFREAHHRVGQLVRYCIESGIALEELSPEVLARLVPEAGGDVTSVLLVNSSVSSREHRGGTGEGAVRIQIAKAREVLSNAQRNT